MSDIPTFVVKRVRATNTIQFVCPKCGRKNSHGGCGSPGAGDGHRVSHCQCWPNGYYLKEATDGTANG
jgi:hypothetical protein